mgnify:FL=1
MSQPPEDPASPTHRQGAGGDANGAAAPPGPGVPRHIHRVGDYSLKDTIGHGAHSQIRFCVHDPTQTEWVAKIVSKNNREVRQLVATESTVLRRIVHRNVVMMKEILETKNNYYLILEAVMGGDLVSKMNDYRDGMPEPVCAKYFSQIVAGLNQCHQLGVTHRDLKPDNILISTNDEVKISDFGLSRVHRQSRLQAEPNEMAKTLTGTLQYAAPEVLAQDNYDAFKADIWSLGCLLFVMLSGRFPFGGGDLSFNELQRRISGGQISRFPPDVAPETKQLILSMLSVDPAQRPTLDYIMAHPFMARFQADDAAQTLSNHLSDEDDHGMTLAASMAGPPGGGVPPVPPPAKNADT